MMIYQKCPVMCSGFLTIGAFADWLGVAPSAPALLPEILNLLTKGLTIPEDPAAAAALTFKHVCDSKKIYTVVNICNSYKPGLCAVTI